MFDKILTSIAENGGGYLLAAVVIYMGWKSQAGIVAVLSRTLDVLVEVKAAVASLTETIRALQSEVAGVRAGLHGVVNAIAPMELRIRELERSERKNG